MRFSFYLFLLIIATFIHHTLGGRRFRRRGSQIDDSKSEFQLDLDASDRPTERDSTQDGI